MMVVLASNIDPCVNRRNSREGHFVRWQAPNLTLRPPLKLQLNSLSIINNTQQIHSSCYRTHIITE